MADDGAPAGLIYVPEFVDEAEARALLGHIEGLPFHAVVMRGVAARRTVVHYGWDYGYDSWRITPTEPIPAFLHALQARAGALPDIPAAALEQVLIARYPPGATIGWHRDAPMFGPTVVGVSLGGDAVMRFRRPADGARYRLALAARSAYVLGGAARVAWQHSLAPTATLRYSITFRTVRAATRREARQSP